MNFKRALLFGLLALVVAGCSRYDYYPRGIHQDIEKKGNAAGVTTYVVAEGDTLYSIGKKYQVDFERLALFNGIRRPYRIFVGQRIYIGGKEMAMTEPKVKSATKPSKKASNKSAKTYTKTKTLPEKKYLAASHSKVQLNWPTQGKLSSRFGPRAHRMHDGIDIEAKEGTTVNAAAAGKVVYADSRLSGYGNLIIIRHSTDMFTAYAHNQRNLVSKGQTVEAGQRIALVGSSGRSTAPHLHFEVRRGETAVDPLAYLPKKQ